MQHTLLLISGVSFVVAFLISCVFFLLWCFSLALASQAATWSVSRLGSISQHVHSEALLVFRTNGFLPGFVAIFWGGSGLVCVAFERRRVEFSTSLETGLNCHGIRFRRSLSTNLFLCVWEGRQMDGGVGSSDLNCADLAISSLPYLTCFSRLAIAIWKDDGRVKPEEALVVEVQGGACR